jgi:hypothetical protein
MVATDADLPTNRLTFLISAPFVSGATVNGGTGVLTWTPTEAQGGSNFVVTVRVSDNGSPSLSATQSFTITVRKINSAPVLTNLNNTVFTINELTSISLTNKATDTDVPTNVLTYELLSALSGATVDPATGIFTWTPSEAQGPSSNSILVRVFDDGTPSLSATQRFSIVVNEVNLPPVLSPIVDRTVDAGQLLSFANQVDDPDLPPQALRFSLVEGPDGANINAETGVFRWTPACAQGSTTNRISVRVTDNGLPVSLSATQSFSVVVLECIEASLGNGVVQAGGSSGVAIRLLSTVELTNFSFAIRPPPARFTNLAVHPDISLVTTSFTSNLANGDFFVNFTLPGDRILQGPTNVADLSFEALANQTSAFVWLDLSGVAGQKPNGDLVVNRFGHAGRVAVVGEAPLLEAVLSTNGQVQLVLYALPGTTNCLETTTVLTPQPLWTPWQTNIQTSLAQTLLPPSATNQLFIRAVKQ